MITYKAIIKVRPKSWGEGARLFINGYYTLKYYEPLTYTINKLIFDNKINKTSNIIN